MRDLEKEPCFDIELSDYCRSISEGDVSVVKWLRESNYDAYFFGLGFIQVKMSPRDRFHFYHKDLTAIVENPHDHRYNFVSNVLKGTLETHVWEECAADHRAKVIAEVEYASCQKDGKDIVVPNPYPAYVEHSGYFRVSGGSSYYINQNTFHSVSPDFKDGPCITMLERGRVEKEFAKVLKVDKWAGIPTDTCPFSKELSDDELWEIVERCIREKE